MSEPEPTAEAAPIAEAVPTAQPEPAPPTPGGEDPAVGRRRAGPRRRPGVAGAAVGDLLVRLEGQIFRAQPTAQLQLTRTDEVTAQTSEGPVVVAFPAPVIPPDTDEPAGGA